MTLSRSCLLASLCLSCVFTTLQACGDEEPGDTSDAGVSSSGGPSSSSSGSSGVTSSSSSGEASSSSGSSGVTSSSSGSADPDASFTCGPFPEFGAEAVDFVQDEQAGAAATGGDLIAGTYDAVIARRSSALGGWVRETLVIHEAVDGVRAFERIRQIKQRNGEGDPGPIQRRAGTVSTEGTQLRYNELCGDVASDGGAFTPDESGTPYSISVGDAGQPELRYGAALAEIVLRKRAQ